MEFSGFQIFLANLAVFTGVSPLILFVFALLLAGVLVISFKKIKK